MANWKKNGFTPITVLTPSRHSNNEWLVTIDGFRDDDYIIIFRTSDIKLDDLISKNQQCFPMNIIQTHHLKAKIYNPEVFDKKI